MTSFNPQYPYIRNSSPQYSVSNGITWVQGVEGAKAFQLPPNSNAQLMDSENDGIFYIKVSDNIGMSTLRVFRYTEIETTPKESVKQQDLSEYVRKDELQQLISELLSVKQEDRDDEQTIPTASTKHKSTIQ